MISTSVFYKNIDVENESENESESEEASEKTYPNDMQYFMRTYPDNELDMNGYRLAYERAFELNQSSENRTAGDWKTQGPANIGAYITSLAVHPQNENIIYLGYAQGGLFRTTDNCNTWTPIFDKEKTLSIGTICIDPNVNTTLYVGTGDPNVSGFPVVGNGVYKSTDSGNTWKNLGLSETAVVSKVLVSKADSKVVFAATMGLPFKRTKDRGLYKSIDGGTTWKQKLFVSDSTGVCDMMLDPNNPNIVYAATWDRIRNNKFSIVAGKTSKIMKSIDGGETWFDLMNGIPADTYSRFGLAMSGINSNTIFTEVVGKDLTLNAIYKSTNGGSNWVKIPTNDTTGLLNPLSNFGWYFGQIRVNPKDDNDIYVLGVDLWRTKNSGQTWDLAAPVWYTYEVHADKHAMEFTKSGKIIIGTDGGAYRSQTDSTWEDIENIATTQFYRVAYNPHNPTFYYGGAQDNGTTSGNLANSNSWERVYGGDGFQTRFFTNDSLNYFVETQNGNIVLKNQNNPFSTQVNDGIDIKDRRNWDMQYFISKHDETYLYTGTEKVYKGEFFGDYIQWDSISKDLTDGNIYGARFHSISTIEESPITKGLLYVGTTDANVWTSFNDGKDWKKISNGLPERYVTRVVPSVSFANTVYCTLSGYKENVQTPHIFRSDNKGSTWYPIAGNLPPFPVNDLLILPNKKDSLLFAATDGGVYWSKNAGTNWLRLGNNMPFITVYDLEYNPVLKQIIAGTFSRSIMTFNLSDINLVATKDYVNENDVKLFPSVTSDKFSLLSNSDLLNGEAKIQIYDLNGKLLFDDKRLFQKGVSQDFSISNYASGIYFISLSIDNQRVVKKVVKG